MGRNLIETLMGAVVVVVAAGFLIFAYSTSNVGDVEGYHLFAKFDRVDGIQPGADVRISGIKVGSVIGERLDPDTYLAELSMSIKPSVKIPTDSAAKILMSGLLGGNYVAISPGGSEKMMKSGDTFQYTQGSVDLISLVGQAVFGKAGGGGTGGAKGGGKGTELK